MAEKLDWHLQYFQRIFNWRKTNVVSINGNSEVVVVDGDVHVAVIVTAKRVVPIAVHFFSSLYCEG